MKNLTFIIILFIVSCQSKIDRDLADSVMENAVLANEGFARCQKYTDAWLEHADVVSGLIPRNLNESYDIWNAKDAAADNYPFMVLTSSFTDQDLFETTMREMLVAETRLTSRIGNMPDTYSFRKQDFVTDEPDTGSIIFGASEYIKDGLLPLTEWLGPSPWSERMIQILDDIWEYAPIKTEFGNIPSFDVEINGEMLQVLSRIFWMTGEQKYLDWAIRLGDYYLLADHHPTQDFEKLRLRDHGCEIVSGLCELYVAVHFSNPEKKALYKLPIKEILDRILEVGINEDGMFYNNINPQTGEPIGEGLADTYGYTYNGFYSVFLIDEEEEFRDAVLHVLTNLENYKNYNWESGSSDGFADAIESALNLYNREPISDVANWLDSETKIMWSLQDSSYQQGAQKYKDSGIIEGWHGDGNFARTTLMYCLWKTKGTHIQPWRPDVKIGAVQQENELVIGLSTDIAWQGKIKFDVPRHQKYLNLPLDYPRINQFPEWFTVDEDQQYTVLDLQQNIKSKYLGNDLITGLPVRLEEKGKYFYKVIPE